MRRSRFGGGTEIGDAGDLDGTPFFPSASATQLTAVVPAQPGANAASVRPDEWRAQDNAAGGAISSNDVTAQIGQTLNDNAAGGAIGSNDAMPAQVGQTLNDNAATGTIGPNGATPAQVRQALNATNLGFTGAGFTVGVLSDSFNNLGGAATDEANGALPPASKVGVLKDLPSGGTDEGRAMMQVVHDVAPNANLFFYTAAVSEQDFANGILTLANAGCRVICDDYDYFDEPFYQTGVVANAVQTAEQAGVMFVTMAFNNGAHGYQAAWKPITNATVGTTMLHDTQDFGNGSPTQTVTVGGNPNAQTVRFVVQWNQPYGAATSNLQVVVFFNNSVYTTATRVGNDPDIQFSLQSGFTYTIAIQNLSGPDPGQIKEISEDDGFPPITISTANSGTVQGHHMSPYAITVGAVDAANAPALGGTLKSESFSGSGFGTQLWYNFNGSAIAGGPLIYNPLAVSGIDDINTTVPGNLTRFFGTSCATPSVAGVVADMLQANPNLTFAQVKQILQQTAAGFGDPFVAGSGLVNAAAAVQLAMQTVNGPPSASTTADLILRHNTGGLYEIYDIGNNAILAGYQLGVVGTDYQFVGLGNFNGSDTTDMMLRSSTSGAFQVYDVSNNRLTGSASLGAVGLNWQVMGFGNFSSFGETDMMLRNVNTGGVEVYDLRNNQIIGANFMGTVGLNWQVGGFGNFSSRGTSDMILRNTQTGGLEVYDINSNQITGAAFMGTVGLDWQIIGVGNFSSMPGETDVMMRNTKTGGLEVYDIANNQITGAAFLGTVGLDWQFAGVAPVGGAGRSDLVLRNVNTGAFEVYDIANNQITGAALLGQVGLDWQLGGFAVDPPTASTGSMGSSGQAAQLVQAMAGFGGGSGAADSLNTAPLGTETSHQPLLTTPQHG
jgi:hypothetical protein